MVGTPVQGHSRTICGLLPTLFAKETVVLAPLHDRTDMGAGAAPLSSAQAGEDVDHQLAQQESAREGTPGTAPALQSPLRINELSPRSGAIQRLYALPVSETVVRGLRHSGRIVLQLGLIVAVCLAGEKIASVLPINIPGNICSMLLLLAFLTGGVIRMESIGDAANFLLDNMAIFFIPAAVAIMGSFDLLAGNILKLVAICLITTVLVFFVTSFTVATVANLMERHRVRTATSQPASPEQEQ